MKTIIAHEIRLALTFFLLLFLAGRIGLLLHEFGGHALTCRLLGGRITEYSLFLFGGGRVHYDWALSTVIGSIPAALFVQLSGIAVELAVGIPLAVLALRRISSPFVNRLLAATAGVLIVHALFYLVISAYYGSGDGTVLFALLQGGSRRAFLISTFCMTVSSAFLVSYAFSPATRGWIAVRSRKLRTVLIVMGVVSAALLHGALTIGEKIIVKDTAYAELKLSQHSRLMAEELSEFVAGYARENGSEPDPESIAAIKKALKAKYRQFPIEVPLGIAVLLAFIAGFFLSTHRAEDHHSPVTWKEVGVLGAFSGFVAVIILMAS